MLKCAYCTKEFSPFYVINGTNKNGYRKVSEHVEAEHPEQWSEIQKALRQFDFDSGLDDMSSVPLDM